MLLTLLKSCASTTRIFKNEVDNRFKSGIPSERIITTEDLEKLPVPMANYLNNCGWLGKPIPYNFSATMTADFSLKKDKYIKVKMKQYNWLDEPTRIFHIYNWMLGGRHYFDRNGAYMLIKVMKRIKVVNAKGPIMNQSELVTYLNDLLLLAPGAVVAAPIEWNTLDNYHVKATISYFGNTVSAMLTFNENYELVNFMSNDRYASKDGKEAEKLPWSTPVGDYQLINGIKAPSYGEAIWHYPDYDYTYIKMTIQDLNWNLKQLAK